MTVKPWSDDAKTPCNTCNATCAKLFKEGKLLKTNHIHENTISFCKEYVKLSS